MVNLFARTPADNFRVMPYNLRLFAMLGLWGDRRKLYRLYVLLLLAYVAIIFPKPVRITDRHPFESIVRSVSELIFAALCYLTIIILAIKSEPFRAVIHKLEQALELCTCACARCCCWTPIPATTQKKQLKLQSFPSSVRDKQDQCSQLIIEVNANIHRFSLGYAKLNLLYVLLFNIIPPIYNYPRYFLQWRLPEDNRTVEFMLPLMQDLYGLDVHHNIVHYTISWVAITPFCVFFALILWFKGALFMLIRYNTLLYQLVNRLLQQYDRESAGGLLAQKHRRLQQIVQLHYSAIECTKLLDSILSLILLIQCIGCLLMLCLMLFYITRNHSLNVINIAVLLMSIFIEMLCFSYLGNQLTEEVITFAML